MSKYYEGDGKGGPITLEGLFSYDQLKQLEARRPEPVIDGFMYAGETVLLAGRPKVGKSLLGLQAALSIVRGTEFLGMSVPRARRVLMIDLENRPWATRDRVLRMVGEAHDVSGFYVWCANSLTTHGMNASADGIAKLKEQVSKTDAEVLMIDLTCLTNLVHS